MGSKYGLIATFISLFALLQLSAQTPEEQFEIEIGKSLDLSALKENPILDYAESDSVINSINQQSDSTFKARFFNLLGQLNFETGEYAISLEYFLTAKDFVNTGTISDLGALIFINIGNVYYKNEDFEAAKSQYEKGRQLALDTEQFGLAATASNNIGLLCLRKKKYKNAEFYFNEALTIRKTLSDNYLIAHSLQYMGMLKFHEQKMDSASFYYSKALQVAQSLDAGQKESKLIISLSNNLSFCYLELGEISKALLLANQVTKQLEGIENQYFYCSALNQTANVFFKCGDFLRTEKLCQTIIEIAGLENYFEIQQKAFDLLSKVKEEQGDFKSAIRFSRKSQQLKTRIRHNFADKKLANQRFGQQVLGSKKLLNIAQRESELKTRELDTQQRINELLVLLVIVVLIAVVSLVYSNREKQKSNKQLTATNHLIEKQNDAIRKQQNELELAKKQLELKVNELEQLTTDNNHLLGIVAHDLRTPLNSILGLSELLEMEFQHLKKEERNDSDEYLKLITESIEKMLHMINQILTKQSFERREIKTKKKKVEISELISKVVSDHKKWSQEKNISIELKGDFKKIELNSDEILIQQVLSNLLSNAIKYSNPDTSVKIGVSEEHDWVIFSIKDSGPGFSDEDKKALFQPYIKLSASPTAGETSFGFGLSSAKKVSEALHGKLWLESNNIEGSTFFFELPKGVN